MSSFRTLMILVIGPKDKSSSKITSIMWWWDWWKSLWFIVSRITMIRVTSRALLKTCYYLASSKITWKRHKSRKSCKVSFDDIKISFLTQWSSKTTGSLMKDSGWIFFWPHWHSNTIRNSAENTILTLRNANTILLRSVKHNLTKTMSCSNYTASNRM